MQPAVGPIIDRFSAGQLSFNELVTELVAFPWRKPTPEVDSFGDYPEHEYGQAGTYEEVEAAVILGQLTRDQEEFIASALDAELVRKYGPEILEPKTVSY